MIVGKYLLHLYCDHPEHDWRHGQHPAEYTGETELEAMKEARHDGWRFNREIGAAYCHKHAKPRKTDRGER